MTKEQIEWWVAGRDAALRGAPHGPFCLSFTIIEGAYPVADGMPPRTCRPRQPPDESLCDCWMRLARAVLP